MKKKSLCALLIAMAMFASSCGNLYSEEEPAAPAANTGAPADTAAADDATESVASDKLVEGYEEFKTPRAETITWFEQGWSGMEPDKDFVTPELAARTNFTFGYEPMSTPTGDDYRQKLNLMVASGDIPRVFFGGQDAFTRSIYDQLGASDKLWDISEIIKDYENLYELVKPELAMYRAPDDKNYQIPTQTGRGNDVVNEAVHGLFIDQNFLNQLGMEMPTTPEELYTYFKRAKSEITVNGEPTTGLLFGEDLGGIEQIHEMFIPNIGITVCRDFPYNYQKDFAVDNYYYTDSPELIEAMKYLNKLQVEGLIDTEALTIKTAQFEEKASSGKPIAITAAWWDMNKYSDVAQEDHPDLMYIRPSEIFANENVRNYRMREWTNWVGSWSSLIINKEVPEDVLRHLLAVMDYMATEEGQLLVQAGLEGVSFEWTDDGKYVYTDDYKQKTSDLDWNKSAAYGVGYYSQLVFNIPVFENLRETPNSLLREDNLQSWKNRQWYWDLYRPEMDPPVDYYFTPGEVETAKFPAIEAARREFFAKVIASKPEDVENVVHEWAATCKKLGVDDIIAEREQIMANLKAEYGF